MSELEKTAYCLDCKKVVKVVYLQDCDETGEAYDIPSCSECLCEIANCHDCDKWTPDNLHTPLGETKGTCEETKEKVHAMDLICPKFKEWRKDNTRKPKLCGYGNCFRPFFKMRGFMPCCEFHYKHPKKWGEDGMTYTGSVWRKRSEQ